ncbi:signal transduction histidine-protein kinase/phosphatase UhpB, partial [Escherichia coli]
MTKHARAENASITVRCSADAVVVVVEDDGRGGADLAAGSGLAGLRDRVEALGGVLAVEGPA